MNILKKTLSSLAIASFGLVMASSVWAETATPSAEQPNVVEKKAPTKEELAPANKDLKIESSNEKFAEKYPNQYNSWKDTSKSTEAAPAVEQDPRLIVLWGGYAFAKEYNKPRGHFYSVTDVRNILRTGAPKLNDENSGPQPMACWTCKGPDVPRLIAELGEEGYFSGKWAKGGAEVVNSIGCADCHDTTSKEFEEGKPALRIARPHVLRALDAIQKDFASLDRDDKRAAICANCHVEYYFDKSTGANNVVFPWMKGVDVDSIEKYYDEIGFKDWEHSISKAPMLKAQHPDYETWLQGTHGKNGVTCIDCHMAKVQGPDGKVFTDHRISNPLQDNFENTCAKCHDQSKETLTKTIAAHKKDIKEVMIKLEDQLVKAHFEAKAAWDAGATKEEMQDALQAIRHAQWRWDYSAAGHGGHMHAPDIILKVIASGLDRVADARAKLAVVLAKHGVQQPIQYPDVSTAEKAWKVMGIDIEKERKDKEEFIKTVIPEWNKEAIEKGLILTPPPAK
ncbi:ammonia-forming nitrite reductase cytochrome c552 subunit [Actinobacillus porcinus]|uniref:ammonia-forming nitrite reductase cytochrome c552 subunit n=1 Tax=Actinobacillus porcinus TaxID=51048 RepID=UPI003B595981